jgi:hypothetical protein
MLSARDIVTRSGTVTVEIDTTVTDEIVVQKLGSIKIDNDIDRGERQISTLTTSYGAVTVVFWDNTTNQVSLFDTIRANATDDIPARVLIDTNGVQTSFAFTVRKSQISFDERAQLTTVQFLPPVFTDSGTQALIAGSARLRVWDGGGSLGTYDCLSAHDFILEALESMSGGTTTEFEARTIAVNYVHGSSNFRLQSIFDPATTTNDRVHFVITDRTNVSVTDIIARLSALNGALFGFAFGRNYWIPKNSITAPVTLSATNLDELTVIPIARSVRDISVRLVNVQTSQSNILANSVATRDYSGQGDRSISYAYDLGNNFQIGIWQSTQFDGDGVMNDLRNAGGTQPEVFLVGQPASTGAVDSYASVYGAGGNRIRITATINDVYALKPWQCFQFDTTVPARYRTRIYRASTLEYDFIKGTCKLSAYSIT